jgi:copper transport protein
MRCRPLLVALFVLLLMSLVAPAALAHTSLQTTDPPAGAALAAPPEQIWLRFSGKVSLPAGGIVLTDAAGALVTAGQPHLDPADAARVVLPGTGALPEGAYTVTWRVVSADGHAITGAVPFAIGAAAARAPGTGQAPAEQGPFAPPPPPVPPAVPNALPPAGVALGYWLTAVGLMAFAGLALVQGVLRLGQGGSAHTRLQMAAWAAALLGTLVQWVARTAGLQGATLAQALANPPALWETLTLSTGPAMLARLLLLVAILPLLSLAARRWQAGAVLGAFGLLTLALGGHALTTGTPPLAVTLDWLHLLGGSAWVGGLLQFAFLLRGPELGAQVKRFSYLAAGSVAVLTATGLYPALLHVPSGEALQQTVYGTALLTKLVVVLALLALGAANLVVVGPALRRGEPVSARFRWLVLGEVLLVGAVLGATAVLTNSAPAREALPPKVLYMGLHSGHHELVFSMAPLAPGTRTLDVWINPHEGTVGPELKVTLTPVHAHGSSAPVEARYVGKGVFRFEQVALPLAGEWELQLDLEHPGGHSEKVKTWVEVPR